MSVPRTTANRRNLYFLYALLAVFQGALAAAQLLRIPSDPKHALLFGLSAERLVLLSVPVLLVLLAGGVAYISWKGAAAYDRLDRWLHPRLTEKRLWRWAAAFSSVAILLSAVFLLVAARESLFVLAPRGILPELEIDAYFVDLSFFEIELYLPRLKPLVVLLLGLSIQNLAVIPALLFGARGAVERLKAGMLPLVLLVFGLSLLALRLALSALQRLGPDVIGWNTIGAPLMETQVLAAAVLGFLGLGLGIVIKKRTRLAAAALPARKHADKILFLLIWMLAALHWSSIPLQASWYLAGPQAPNFEFYPTSDSLVYDTTAQSMLVGEGLSSRPFDDIRVRRPLFVFFIGLLRTVAGQSYPNVAALQSVLLALFPAIVFLTVRDLHSRLAGLIAAGLIIAREGNAIALADKITIAHSKLLMSDLPAALGIALLVWLLLPWVAAPLKAHKKALAGGGVLGGLILIRPESAVLLPAAGILALWRVRGRLKSLLPGLAWIAAGTILVLTPWVTRNFVRTGKIFIEVPGERSDFLINRLFKENGARPPGPFKIQADGLGRTVESDAFRNISRHFLHSNLQSILLFPTIFRPLDAAAGFAQHDKSGSFWETCCARENYITRLPFWQWYKWDLRLPVETFLPIGVNILILTIGWMFAFRRRGVPGLLPAAFGQAYLLVNAVARTSGGRYLLPVDWIWVAYYAIGLGQILLWGVRLFTTERGPTWMVGRPKSREPSRRPGARALGGGAAAILLIAALLPLGEGLYPKMYPDETPQAWLDSALALSASEAEIRSLIQRRGGVTLHGRSTYVRYLEAGVGEPGSTFPSLYAQPSPRLTFILAGPISSGIVLPLEAFPVEAHPNGEDVLVIGCRVNHPKRPYVEAVLVYFPQSGVLLERVPFPDADRCPRPEIP